MLEVFADDAAARAVLTAALDRRSLYDEFLRLLARRGLAVPADVLRARRARAPPRGPAPGRGVPRDLRRAGAHWDVYETCEELVDIEDNLQLWRFRHLKTVERTIGFRTGTGGTTGASFLRRVLDLSFFPELYAVRTAL